MGLLTDYVLFLLKLITALGLILCGLAGALALIHAFKEKVKRPHLAVEKLNQHYQAMKETLEHAVLPKSECKKAIKAQRKVEKAQKKQTRKRVFVIRFDGDIRASATRSLTHVISAVLTVATTDDEVVLRLESPGGMVPHYGLAAAQLHRLRQHNIPLTVIIDKVAASGGYLMACVANKIVAAPFAIVGSIGVFAQIPNLHRWLKEKQVDIEQLMAGPHKRTLTVLGKNTKAGRHKAQEEIDLLHELFKQFILDHRAHLDMDQVATGEHWYGKQALDLQLIDAIGTSEDYLLRASETCDLYAIKSTVRQKWTDKLFRVYTKLLNTPLQSNLLAKDQRFVD